MSFPWSNFDSDDDSESTVESSSNRFNFKRFDRSTKSKLGRRRTAQANFKPPSIEPSISSLASKGDFNVATVRQTTDEVDGILRPSTVLKQISSDCPSVKATSAFDDARSRSNHNNFGTVQTPVRMECSFGNDSSFVTAIDIPQTRLSEKTLLSVCDSPGDLLARLSDEDSASLRQLVQQLNRLSTSPVKILDESKENVRPTGLSTPSRLDVSNDGVQGMRSFIQDIFKKPNPIRSETKRESSILYTIPEKSNEFSLSWPTRPISPTVTVKATQESSQGPCCCKCHKPESVTQNMLGTLQMIKPENILRIKGVAYTVLSVLGRGGSSVVYLVMSCDNPDGLAVKCVNLGAVDKSIAEGHLKEIEALERLQDCSTVIRMFDYEYIEKTKMLYVVMEKGDTDLSKLIKNITQTRKLPVSMILSYWEEMLAAVKDIHDRGIIHSDLKPANFLLVQGRLKLIDFGIASTLNPDMTSVIRETLAGTCQYMSPEAVRNVKMSYKSDVWSLGIILFNLLYGRTPFANFPNNWSRLQNIGDLDKKVEFPEEAEEAPHPILGIALRMCLEKDPKKRPTVDKLIRLSQLSIPRNHPLAQCNFNYYANEVAKFDDR